MQVIEREAVLDAFQFYNHHYVTMWNEAVASENHEQRLICEHRLQVLGDIGLYISSLPSYNVVDQE